MDVQPENDELETLVWIYPELSMTSSTSPTIEVPVVPEAPLAVTFSGSQQQHVLSNLPSVTLKFTLPDRYPDDEPPEVEITTSPPWLPESCHKELQADFRRLWEEVGRSPVLFTIIDYVSEAAKSAFGLGISAPLELLEELEEPMLQLDRAAKKATFEAGTYDCGFCLEPKKGTVCHRIQSCTHIFCRDCLKEYYTSQITEGEISAVRCIDRECVKKQAELNRGPVEEVEEGTAEGEGEEGEDAEEDVDAPAPQRDMKTLLPPTLPPEELEEIGLDKDTVARYRNLKLKKALEADPNTRYCPRSWCQRPTVSSLEQLEAAMESSHTDFFLAPLDGPTSLATPLFAKSPRKTNPADFTGKLQHCSGCGFYFCSRCKASWHGDHYVCRPPIDAMTAEERANEEYLKRYTTACPTCSAPVLKSHGCNHVICALCETHFCYLCSAYLPPGQPYQHFNTEGTECFHRLWEGEQGDEENRRARNGWNEEQWMRQYAADVAAEEDINAPAVVAPAPAPVLVRIPELAHNVFDDDGFETDDWSDDEEDEEEELARLEGEVRREREEARPFAHRPPVRRRRRAGRR